jgi:hypothetical protein
MRCGLGGRTTHGARRQPLEQGVVEAVGRRVELRVAVRLGAERIEARVKVAEQADRLGERGDGGGAREGRAVHVRRHDGRDNWRECDGRTVRQRRGTVPSGVPRFDERAVAGVDRCRVALVPLDQVRGVPGVRPEELVQSGHACCLSDVHRCA